MSCACGKLLAAVLAATAACAPAAEPDDPPPLRPPLPATAGRTERAVDAAARWLAGRLDESGPCRDEFPAGNLRRGGRTALVLYALLEAGAHPEHPAVRRAADWLLQAQLTGVYAVAMRARALAALPQAPLVRTRLRKDVAWLVDAAGADGAYTYISLHGEPAERYDNSNAHLAALGVWAGQMRGVDVPREYWQKVERHWTLQQQPRGGWGYRARRAALATKTYGSMTAAGAATLLVCFDRLHRQRFLRCDADRRRPSLDRGLAWLEQHYTARQNPRLGVNWHTYWLFALQRVGLLSGRRSFAGRHWYADGTAELLRAQNADGSFGYAPRTDRTALALLFLARGRQPVLLNKLRWGGTWNTRPHDAATAVRWVASHYERPLRWQVLDADAPDAAWREAPILYLSGAGPLTLTDAQKARLRRFALAGGLIVSEAACASGDFSLDALALYRELFGPYEPARLSADHPLYTAGPRVRAFQDLRGVSNGVRLLAVHVPSDLSRALQLGPANAGGDQRDAFRLFQNFFLYVGARQPEGPRMPAWPQKGSFRPRATIRVARVRHHGNWNPEPRALPRLAAGMGRRHRIRLEITAPVRLADLKAAATPIAVLTGTGELPLSDAEADALRAFFADGGKLLVDAAGGDRTFADAARKHIRPLIRHADFGELREKVFRTGPAEIEAIRYRPALARVLGPERHRARLRAWYSAERLVAVFSPDDLTAGLLGYRGYRVRGYHPDTATAIVTNVLCHFAGVAAADNDGPAAPREPAPAGAEEPAPAPSADE